MWRASWGRGWLLPRKQPFRGWWRIETPEESANRKFTEPKPNLPRHHIKRFCLTERRAINSATSGALEKFRRFNSFFFFFLFRRNMRISEFFERVLDMFEEKSLRRLKSIALVVRYSNDSRWSGIRPIFSFRIMRMNSYILFLNTLHVLNIVFEYVSACIFELKNSWNYNLNTLI